jgi:hypothetical protein
MSDGEQRKDQLSGDGEHSAPEEQKNESPEASAQDDARAQDDAQPTGAKASGPAEGPSETSNGGDAKQSDAALAETPSSRGPQRSRDPQRRGQPGRAPGKNGLSRSAPWIAVALVVGAAGGWFAREARANTLLKDSSASAGSCKAWENQICESVGAEAFACMEAKAAAGLLPSAACEQALGAVSDTLAKVKESRLVCDELVSKLCTDLGNETQTCQMVREKTHSFPPDRCQEMHDNYDAIIGQLRMMEQAQGGRMAPPGHPAHPGAVPPAEPGAPSTPGSPAPGAHDGHAH